MSFDIKKIVSSAKAKADSLTGKSRKRKSGSGYYDYGNSYGYGYGYSASGDYDVRNEGKIGDDLDFASAEAYNMLRTSIEFTCISDEDRGKIIGVTSSCPQEGKSLTSINLAYAIAKKGHRVLLIEGDLRRPTIAKSLDLERSPGLTNLLVEGVGDVVRRNVMLENLNVITSGDIPPNPSELIGSARMDEELREFAKYYDFVILDLPPVNAVSDAYTVSKFVDGILLVVKHDYTRRSELTEAYRQLSFANAKILGVVYNGYYSGGGYYRKSSRYKYYKKYGYKGKYYNNYYAHPSGEDKQHSQTE